MRYADQFGDWVGVIEETEGAVGISYLVSHDGAVYWISRAAFERDYKKVT